MLINTSNYLDMLRFALGNYTNQRTCCSRNRYPRQVDYHE